MADAERNVRQVMDNWKFWVGVAYFGLVSVVIALFFLNRDISRQQAISQAESRAAAVSQVATCAAAVRNSPDVKNLFDAIRFSIVDRIYAAKAGNDASRPGDPLITVRNKTIEKATKRLRGLDSIIAKYINRTPSKAKCNKLAADSGVPKPFPKA